MRVLNTRLLLHPMNWIEVMLMLIIAGMFGHYLLALVGVHPSSGNAADFSQYVQNEKPTPSTVA